MLTWPTGGVPPGGAASAAQQTTYTGVFAGHIIYEGCATTPHPGTTTGSWSITLAGLLTVTMKNDGKMTYTIAPYNYGDLSCDSVTFPGHIT